MLVAPYYLFLPINNILLKTHNRCGALLRFHSYKTQPIPLFPSLSFL